MGGRVVGTGILVTGVDRGGREWKLGQRNGGMDEKEWGPVHQRGVEEQSVIAWSRERKEGC